MRPPWTRQRPPAAMGRQVFADLCLSAQRRIWVSLRSRDFLGR